MFVIQLGSTMILARILNPADYGMNAMAVAVTGFAAVFSSLGLSTATIQRADINHQQVSTLFWINAGVGLFITLIVASLSPVVAWFYKTPELFWVMIALSSTFFISGLSVQHTALLNRQMRFYSLAKIQVFSSLMGILVAIFAARNGFGYWALVFNTLTNVSINVFGTWLACRWVPGLPCRNVGVSSLLKFGSDIMAFNVINYFSRNLDNILIGRYHGSSALGFYSKAYQLLMMPITNLRDPITRVAMPALSRLQDDSEAYRSYYLKCVSLLAFVSMPIVVFMFVCSDQLIITLLGGKWLGASDIFKILAIAAFVQPVSSTWGMVLLSTGRSTMYLSVGVVNAVFTCLAFVSGLPWGGEGVATAYALINYILLFPILFYSFQDTSIRIKDFILAIYKPFIASLVTGGGGVFLLHFYIGIDGLKLLMICFIAYSVSYLLTLVVIPGGIHDFKEYFSYIRLLIEKK